MAVKWLYGLAGIGFAAALGSAFVFGQQSQPQPPVFNPPANPYSDGIHANGVIESFQSDGANINIYPEVAGPITRILVAEGSTVRAGAPLLTIDNAVQRATAEQQQAQMEAAHALLDELKASPRPEALAVAAAQVGSAEAQLKTAQDSSAKLEQSFALEPKSVSKDALDTARDAVNTSEANLGVAQRQYTLIKAGAWHYDILNQERQYEALSKSYLAAEAILDRYTVKAPQDGVVLSISASAGSYVSPQGAYDTYTQGYGPVVMMGAPQAYLEVRAYVDEILVHRLPPAAKIKAVMFVQGTDIRVPLTFERVQPFVSPKIELSNQREERVDVRVLPVIFKFAKPENMALYPGQLVDVYIGADQPNASIAK